MAIEQEKRSALQRAKILQEKGYVAAVAEDVTKEGRTIRLSIVAGSADEYHEEVKRFIQEFLPRENSAVLVEADRQEEAFAFLGEIRPGSGIIRRAGGGMGGPGGTLTCLLESSDQSVYLAASGHVLSNYWRDVEPNANGEVQDPHGSIYLNRKGFPGGNSRRSLGKTVFMSQPPKPREALKGADAWMDIGIIRLQNEFELKQRTTCYGDFGEWPATPRDPGEGDRVMKCGAQEVHWTSAVVSHYQKSVWIYGPGQRLYELKNQFIIVLPAVEEGPESEPVLPQNRPNTPFAVAGDSGSMVVDAETKRPLGMLVAGSILDRKYVMTPFSQIQKFWEEKGFVMRRA